MASKKPIFTHPVLEVGVPQYPTPLVPDFYTKNGHIILIEKISTEKGNYEPLPLDGSVVYEGKDSGKWPENLYLVAQRPTEDGEFALRFWANDRTMASQDPWNYGIAYSSDNPKYPVYNRVYVIRRDQYEAIDLGTTDPIFGSAIVVKQEMQELPEGDPMRSLHVALNIVYETVPGPVLSVTANKEGLLGSTTISTQVVTADVGADPITSVNNAGGGTIQSYVEPISSVKSKKTSVSSSGPLSLQGQQYDEYLNKYITTKQEIIPSSTQSSIPNLNILSLRDEPMDAVNTRRQFAYINVLPPDRTEYESASYTTPSLIYGLAVDYQIINNQYLARIIPDMRASQSKITTIRTTTSFSFGPPANQQSSAQASLKYTAKRVYYNGFKLSFDLGPALCNDLAFSIIVTKPNSADLEMYEVYNEDATDLSAYGFLNTYVGKWAQTSYKSVYYKANIWVSTKVETLIF